jgi:DNA-binding response OmpR family regulator
MPTPADMTVLVVDDEADVRTFLSAALIDAGFKVVTASDGIEALDLVKASPPDLISLDLVMPKRSGVKFHRDLIKNKEWSKIPILIVTGHARDDLGRTDLKELTMQGPEIYLEKPVKPQSYIAAIKKLLHLETSERESEIADLIALQSELKNFVDAADPATLKKMKQVIKEQGRQR